MSAHIHELVVYIPTTYSEASQMSSSLAKRNRPPQNYTPQQNYPPNIPISRDGEEGYTYHQLHHQNQQQRCTNGNTADSVCVPPNCTVYDVDAPPPYHSTSAPPYISPMIHGYDLWPHDRSMSFGGKATHTDTDVKKHNSISGCIKNGVLKPGKKLDKNSASCDRLLRERNHAGGGTGVGTAAAPHVTVPTQPSFYCGNDSQRVSGSGIIPSNHRHSRHRYDYTGVGDRGGQTDRPPDYHMTQTDARTPDT